LTGLLNCAATLRCATKKLRERDLALSRAKPSGRARVAVETDSRASQTRLFPRDSGLELRRACWYSRVDITFWQFRMPEKLGARLRQRREQQKIALSTIAEQTKIKASLLEELERDDVSHWPTGIFRRAFIRAYALAIGLDPDGIVREFLERFPDPVEDLVSPDVASPGDDETGASVGPPTRFRYLVDSTLSRLGLGNGQKVRPADASSPVAARPPTVVVPTDPDLLAAANLCTQLGRLDKTSDVAPLLHEVVRILDAVGLVVWVWHADAAELRPALAQGYSEKVLSQLPPVRSDADNATAAAFRSAQACAVDGSSLTSGALVVPLITAAGCLGALAMELRHGGEHTGWVRALVMIFAAQLARVIEAERPVEASQRRLA
jgi:transcriptional regulator with XRE-family HTH domain